MELTSPFDFVKRSVLAVQDYTHLSLRSLVNLFRKPFYMADAIQQADLIGVGSLPIVVLTGMFTGIVLALNTSKTLEQFGSLSLTGRLVSFSMVRELGDRKSTRLNSSHGSISYAVFCLTKKTSPLSRSYPRVGD